MTDAERFRFDLQGFLVRRRRARRRGRRRAQRRHRRAGRAAGRAGHRQPALHRLPARRPPLPGPDGPPGGARHRPRDVRAERPPRPRLRDRDVARTSGLGLHGGGTPFDPAQHYRSDGGRIRTGLSPPVGARGSSARRRWLRVRAREPQVRVRAPADFDGDLVVEVPLAAGDVVVFTEALTHGTTPWRHAEERRTLSTSTRPATRPTPTPSGPELVAACTERQRLLLQPPSVGSHRPVVPDAVGGGRGAPGSAQFVELGAGDDRRVARVGAGASSPSGHRRWRRRAAAVGTGQGTRPATTSTTIAAAAHRVGQRPPGVLVEHADDRRRDAGDERLDAAEHALGAGLALGRRRRGRRRRRCSTPSGRRSARGPSRRRTWRRAVGMKPYRPMNTGAQQEADRTDPEGPDPLGEATADRAEDDERQGEQRDAEVGQPLGGVEVVEGQRPQARRRRRSSATPRSPASRRRRTAGSAAGRRRSAARSARPSRRRAVRATNGISSDGGGGDDEERRRDPERADEQRPRWPGPAAKPPTSAASRRPRLWPRFAGSPRITMRRIAGTAMPTPTPITKRPASSGTIAVANAIRTRPTTSSTMPATTSWRAWPRSASGAIRTWARKPAKKPMPMTPPSAGLADAVLVPEVVEQREQHAVAGGEERADQPEDDDERAAAHDRRTVRRPPPASAAGCRPVLSATTARSGRSEGKAGRVCRAWVSASR